MISAMLEQLIANLKLMWTLAVRELISMFRVPAGWIIIALFAFLSGVLFVNQTLIPGQPGSMRYFFTASAWLLIPIAPAISMRLMSEEYRTGSFESLRTTPAGDWAVAFGKYIGSVLFLLCMLIPSLVYPIVLFMLSDPSPDLGPIFAGYLMLLLVGALYLAVGLLASSTTSSQTLAFLGTMMALVIFMVLTSVLAPRAGPELAPILDKLSVVSRASEMGKGVIDTSTILFFVIMSMWMVVLTAGVLEARRIARSRWSLLVMGSIFVLTTATATLFAGVLAHTHHVRMDVTATSAHKLSPRALSMVRALPAETRIVLAVNEAETERRALDLVSDVLETYDQSSALIESEVMNLSSIEGTDRIQALIRELSSRESGSIELNEQTIAEVSEQLILMSSALESVSTGLLSIRDAIDINSSGGQTNRAFFEQRATLVRIGAQDLQGAGLSISEPASSLSGTESISLINAQLAQLEDLRTQTDAFAQAPEVSAATRVASRNVSTTLDQVIDDLSRASDRLSRLEIIDAQRVQTALQSGETMLIIGPPELGVSAIDLDTLLPSAQMLEDAGISAAGVIGPRAQELIATAIGQLVIRSQPIIVFVHAGNPGELLGASNLLNRSVDRFKQRGVDTLEWAALHQTERPSFASIDPLGQRPIVYAVLAADSAAGGGDTGITGARRATALAQVASDLLDAGESVMISMNPSIFGSFGNTDPLVTALDPFGLVPDPSRALLTQRVQGSTTSADPATLVVPELTPSTVNEHSDPVDSDSATNLIADAISGLSTVLPWSIPLTIDERVGVESVSLITLQGAPSIWAESDWLPLWSTPANSRQYLRDQPSFQETKDIRRDQWTLAASAQRLMDDRNQRVIVVGSNSWIYDALTFSQGQLIDGRITTAFPGNLALLDSSVMWLAGLDDLIAPGVQSRPIATIRPMSRDELTRMHWILLAGIPGVLLVLGIGSRVVFG
ncbi:MAG: ABC transporter permease [Phycisphaerales bacterium]